jgi:methyl halide transferase
MENANPAVDWQLRYEANDTPWDHGEPTPALVQFLYQEQVSGRVLVPGCGRGHDARALGAQPNVSVVGLDLSPMAVAQAKELSAANQPDSSVSFITEDFLNLPANLRRSFDWLVEHTCFCAIDPSLREQYVSSASSALRTGGKIFGIFYLNPDVESGPPFAVTKEELSSHFDPHFTLLEEWVPKESFPGREGRELVRVMVKKG